MSSNNASSRDLVEPVEQKENQHKEEWPDFKGILSRQMRSLCTIQTILNRFPIIALLRTYKWSFLYYDFVAGVSVGLTAIPQSIAYAGIAGIDTQYGLYASFIACFLYTLFGSGVELCIGPTAIMSLMIQKYVIDSQDFAIFISFIIGIITFTLGTLNLGFLVRYISIPVTCGFTTAAAITISCGQVKALFGMPGRSSEFIQTIEDFIHDFHLIKLWDSVLGVSMIVFLLLLWKLKDVKGKLAPLCKYISLGRNALAVIIGTILAFFLTNDNFEGPFILTGDVRPGLPPVQLPPFSTVIRGETLNFGEMMANVGTGFIAISLIAILEVVAVSKAFANGRYINANQELMALGAINFFGSFVQAMPMTGSFSRSAINKASDCRSTLSSAVTGVIVLIAVAFMTGTFKYIPKTVLASVIIAAMIFTVEFKEAYHIWKTKRIDILPFVVTLVACLTFSLEYGILIGVAVNLLFILYTTSRPNTASTEMTIGNHRILLIEPDQSLSFSSAEYLKLLVIKEATELPDVSIVVLNGRYVRTIDVTVAENLKSCLKDLNINKKALIFWNWQEQPTHLVWRLDPNFARSFHQCDSLDDLITTVEKLS